MDSRKVELVLLILGSNVRVADYLENVSNSVSYEF